ncbi:putative non-specific serine/threonine protein kinase [Helianthus anomalus]
MSFISEDQALYSELNPLTSVRRLTSYEESEFYKSLCCPVRVLSQLYVRVCTVGDEFVNVKFDIGTGDVGFQSELAVLSMNSGVKRKQANRVKDSLSFTMCKKLVQMMQGKIWMSTNSQGYIQSTSLVLRFQIQQTFS